MNKKFFWFLGILLVMFALTGTTSALFAQADRVTVFRELAFGDNQMDVRRKVLEDDFFSVPMVNRGESALSPRGDVDIRIGDSGLDLIFFFNQAGLYRLDASGERLEQDQFNVISENRISEMQRMLTKAYGSPSFTQRHEPDDFDAGEFRTMAFWSSEHLEIQKEIWLGISRQDNQFQLTLIIQDPKRADQSEYSLPDRLVPEISVEQASELF